MRNRTLLTLTLMGWLVAAPVLGQLTPVGPVGPVCLATQSADVDPRRSLFVTELDVLEKALSLEDVMTALTDDVGNPSWGPRTLWQQLWDTQNREGDNTLDLGPNCDDVVNASGQETINGFPIQCPRNEGAEVRVNPFDPRLDSFYKPIALVNRMDLAPSDGANCGEFRVVFARSGGSRNLIIFEAVLPNPDSGCGLEGCREVARFWAGLSEIDDPDRRAKALREFYLRGFPSRGIEPVIRAAHFGPGAGQLRTNQFMSGREEQIWQLREFKLVQVCPIVGDCFPQFVPVTDKENPFGELFGSNSTDLRSIPFKRHYLTQVKNLATPDINSFFAVAPDQFNAGQSNAQLDENDYPQHFATSPRFQRAVEYQLRRLGSRLTPDELVRRSMALSCAGCHRLNNNSPDNDLGDGIIWPPSLGFTHVSEFQTETIDGSEHFLISDALVDVFIPHREQVFEDYLDDNECDQCETALSARLDPLPPPVITLGEEESLEDVLTPDSVGALDSELKSGLPADSLGGEGRVH
ncbi:hypothetical protein MK489_02015 [Myxococcota bacterium]|nr:hypothetical protein [Myxococcota bacterium]